METTVFGIIAFAFIAGLIFFFTRKRNKKNAAGAGGTGSLSDEADNKKENQIT
jgi:LPXTG-motif cell wall-anchored protein